MALGERWIFRPLFIFALLVAFIRADILFKFLLNAQKFGGLAYFITFAALWAVYALPFTAIQMGLGHFLRGPIGIFSTFPILKSFGWGMLLFHVLWSPYYAMRSAHYGHHFYVSITDPGFKTTAFSCANEWNTAKCVDIPMKNSSLPLESTPLHEYWHIHRPDSPPKWSQDNLDFGIPKNVHWELAAVCCVIFAIAMFILFLGPVLLGPASLALFLALVGFLVTFGIKFWNKPGGALGRKFLFETLDFNKFNLEALHTAATDALYVAGITTGIIPTLASFNYPGSCHLNVIEIILTLILVPGIYLVCLIMGYSAAGFVSLQLGTTIYDVINQYFAQPLIAIPHLIAMLNRNEYMDWIISFYIFGALIWFFTTLVMVEVICSGIVHGCENVTEMKKIALYRPPIAIIVTLCLSALALLLCCKNYAGLVPLFESDILPWSMQLNQVFVFLQLFIFIAYGTIKLFSGHMDVQKTLAKYALVSLMVIFIFILMLFTILYIAMCRIIDDEKSSREVHGISEGGQIPTKDLVSWIIAGAPVVFAVLLLPIVAGVIIIRAKKKNSSILEALFYPLLRREYSPNIQVNSFYGEFDYANAAPI